MLMLTDSVRHRSWANQETAKSVNDLPCYDFIRQTASAGIPAYSRVPYRTNNTINMVDVVGCMCTYGRPIPDLSESSHSPKPVRSPKPQNRATAHCRCCFSYNGKSSHDFCNCIITPIWDKI